VKLSAREAVRARDRRRAAQATLACEGIHLTNEEKALFHEMEEARMSHEARRQYLKEYFLRTHDAATDAAE
jgi:hypothetical protein